MKEEDIDFNEQQLHDLNVYFPVLLDIQENQGIQKITNKFFYHFDKFDLLSDELIAFTMTYL